MKLEVEEEIDSTGASRSKARSCLLPGEMVRQSVPHDAEPTPPPYYASQFESHSATVYCLAYHLTGNTHDAEDLTQDVFVQVLRYRRTYTPNTCEDRLRSATKRLFRDQGRRKQNLQRDALVRGFSDRVTGLDWALDEVDNRSLDGDVRTALDALFSDLRSAVILRDIEGLSCEETAVTLGIDVGTVRSRVRRGRAQLRAALGHRAPRGGGVLPSSQTVGGTE